MRIIDADALIDMSIPVLCGGGNEEMAVLVEDIDSAHTINTKEIKYFDEDDSVWKIGRVIVDGEREGE